MTNVVSPDQGAHTEVANRPSHPVLAVTVNGTRIILNEAAALECVYLAVMSLDPTGQGPLDHPVETRPQRLDGAFEGRCRQAAALDETTEGMNGMWWKRREGALKAGWKPLPER
jgi:hypothetical protein